MEDGFWKAITKEDKLFIKIVLFIILLISPIGILYIGYPQIIPDNIIKVTILALIIVSPFIVISYASIEYIKEIRFDFFNKIRVWLVKNTEVIYEIEKKIKRKKYPKKIKLRLNLHSFRESLLQQNRKIQNMEQKEKKENENFVTFMLLESVVELYVLASILLIIHLFVEVIQLKWFVILLYSAYLIGYVAVNVKTNLQIKKLLEGIEKINRELEDVKKSL